MLSKIINSIKHKYEEYKFTNKILVSLQKLQLENNRVKVLYSFKQKHSRIQSFYLDELSLQNIKFNHKDDIILYKTLGVYHYLLENNEINNIAKYLEAINNGL